MEWAEWPLVTRRRFNKLSRKHEQLKLDLNVTIGNYKSEQDFRRRTLEKLCASDQIIADLRTKLIEANAELLDQKVGGML